MKHRILAYCDHQNSVTCMMGCIFTIFTIIYSIAIHVICKRAQRYPMVDFLTGHRLGTHISSEHRLTGQVLFPNSKNFSLCMRPCPTSSGSIEGLTTTVDRENAQAATKTVRGLSAPKARQHIADYHPRVLHSVKDKWDKC